MVDVICLARAILSTLVLYICVLLDDNSIDQCFLNEELVELDLCIILSEES